MVELLLSYRKFFRLEKDFTVYLYHIDVEDGPFILASTSYSRKFHDYSVEYEKRSIIEHLIGRGVCDFGGTARILTSFEVDREYNKVRDLINDMKDPFGALKRREDKDNYSQICSISSDIKPILNKFLQLIRDNRINEIINERNN